MWCGCGYVHFVKSGELPVGSCRIAESVLFCVVALQEHLQKNEALLKLHVDEVTAKTKALNTTQGLKAATAGLRQHLW
jgi:hypothetical protein